jgi:hypothetical protein
LKNEKSVGVQQNFSKNSTRPEILIEFNEEFLIMEPRRD